MDVSVLISVTALIASGAGVAVALFRHGGPAARIDRALDQLRQITGPAADADRQTREEGISA